MFAYRNIRLCGKDCTCLYVCPTGATNTENSIIDVDKCTGCKACMDACPSGAISMVFVTYPPQQPKTDKVVATQRALGLSKVRQEQIANAVASYSGSAVTRQFAEAITQSNRIMAEDVLRESRYMIPQSKEARELLEAMLENTAPDFPKDAVKMLLNRLQKQ